MDARRLLDLSRLNLDDLRVIFALISLAAAAVVLTVLSLTLDPSSMAAAVALDRESKYLPYPFTVQNLMHFMFALGVGEVCLRHYGARDAMRQLDKDLLGVGRGGEALDMALLDELERRVAEDGEGNERHIHSLIRRVVAQYRATGSVGDAQTVLDSSVEYFQHELGLRYSILRYLTWLLPTLGFIGTLIGISLALGSAGRLPDLNDPDSLEVWINGLTSALGVAFYTTLVALVHSAILMFLTSVASTREERALNETSQHCLDHLINRLRNLRPDAAPGTGTGT